MAREEGLSDAGSAKLAEAIEVTQIGSSVLAAEVKEARREEELREARSKAAADVARHEGKNDPGDLVGDAALIGAVEKGRSISETGMKVAAQSRSKKNGGER